MAVKTLGYLKITIPEPPAPPVAVSFPGAPPPPLPVLAVAGLPLLAPTALTFQHRAGVRPYTSTYVLAEPCVFDKQSLLPGLCHPPIVAYKKVFLIPKLRKYFAEFLQHHSLKRLNILY